MEGATTGTEKRERKTRYYVATSPREFETKKEAEKWLTENRPNEQTRIIRGTTSQHKVLENVVLG